MTRLRFSESDALRCRFTVSPLWETHAALRVVYGPHRRPLYDPWLAQRRQAADAADLGLLRATQPHTGYAPDFLSPPPLASNTSVETELDRVRRTPLERVAAELARCRDQAPANPGAATLDPLVSDPAHAIELFIEVLQRAWHALVEPDWPAVRRILDDDIAYRGECLVRDGLAGLFAELHPGLSWQDGELVASRSADADRDLAGRGLLLVPSAFNWPHMSVIADPDYQPTVVYPARGVARMWSGPPSPPDRLARLLGRTRASILAALDQPATTTGLAAYLGLGLGTVSEHLGTLHDAGLAGKRRAGHQIRYWRSPLGQSLVDAVTD
jgi:DNA-binding transcriptional ArsR family regulator